MYREDISLASFVTIFTLCLLGLMMFISINLKFPKYDHNCGEYEIVETLNKGNGALIFLLEDDNGNQFTINVDSQDFMTYDIGDTYEVTRYCNEVE